MPDMISVTINGTSQRVPAGTVVAVAMLLTGQPSRVSVTGEPRVALCGMGICFECRAMVNGRPHTRTCQIVCEQGMTVETNP